MGDARVLGGKPPKDCWVTETYNILREDPAIRGLIWFVYDKGYEEAGGYVRGAANDAHLVELIGRLGQ